MFYYSMSVDGKVAGSLFLKLYLPSRIGLVLRKIPSKGVYDL
jgi:hypothetical protein